MIKRLFHSPIFHMKGSLTEKKATWLELFYDLIYVAAFIQLGNTFSKSISWLQFFKVAGIFIPLWITWTGYTFYSNRYNVNDFLHRILVFCLMFSVGAMALSISSLLYGKPLMFGVSYAVSLLLIAAMYLRSYLQQKVGADYAQYWGISFTASGLIWLASLMVPSHFYIGWIVGCLVVLCAPFVPVAQQMAHQYPFDLHHLSERYGLLTIIVLGESFVKVLSELSGGLVDFTTVLQASFALLLTCSIWWIYFDDVADSHIHEGPNAMITWLFSHIPLQLSIVLMGVGIKKAVVLPAASIMPSKYAILLCFSIGLALLSTAIIDAVTSREDTQISDKARIYVRFLSAVTIILLGLTSQSFTVFWVLAGTLFVCLFQICFDLISAPFLVDMKELEQQAAPALDAKNMAASNSNAYLTLTPVQKGLPRDFKKDLYFYFIDASWSKVFVTLFFVYILSNMMFAFLYLMVPGAIQNGIEKSFADAFFFSVQTMSTIGFGALAPQGLYSNVIVTIEAAFGLIGIAMVTGLVFSKISKPSAKILFSKPILVTTINGKRTLMFRIGNTRANDIVEAKMTLSALIDEVTPEGETFRRVHYLPLVLEKTPFFRLSWVIRHVIDEDSPLYGIDLKGDTVKAILATVSGHDSTYSDTVHAQHSYTMDRLVEDAYFEDIMHRLPDGRLMIDYDKFHLLKD